MKHPDCIKGRVCLLLVLWIASSTPRLNPQEPPDYPLYLVYLDTVTTLFQRDSLVKIDPFEIDYRIIVFLTRSNELERQIVITRHLNRLTTVQQHTVSTDDKLVNLLADKSREVGLEEARQQVLRTPIQIQEVIIEKSELDKLLRDYSNMCLSPRIDVTKRKDHVPGIFVLRGGIYTLTYVSANVRFTVDIMVGDPHSNEITSWIDNLIRAVDKSPKTHLLTK